MNILRAFQVNLNGYHLFDIMVCEFREEFKDL